MPTQVEMILRVLLAAALGAIVGYQRERAGKAAGLRTNTIICLGSALFTVTGALGFAGGDPSRIAAGIVTGIGFLGAGAILHRHGEIVAGLTTAATIWVVAAIGLAAGSGQYLIACASTAIVLIVLVLPHPIR